MYSCTALMLANASALVAVEGTDTSLSSCRHTASLDMFRSFQRYCRLMTELAVDLDDDMPVPLRTTIAEAYASMIDVQESMNFHSSGFVNVDYDAASSVLDKVVAFRLAAQLQSCTRDYFGR